MEEALFENTVIGPGAKIEEDVSLGFKVNEKCGPTLIGKNCFLRKGTVIYGDVKIGDYFQSQHYVVIRARVKLGDYCSILNHSTIEGIVRVGDGVRIMSNVYIPSRTWIGDNVFIGPGTTFTNGKYPFRGYPNDYPTKGATIEDDVVIGGGVTIMPWITIGERSFVAGGAVVTKDIPPKSLVVGVPGKIYPLPAKLDVPNNKKYTMSKHELWHSDLEYPGDNDWPENWSEKF